MRCKRPDDQPNLVHGISNRLNLAHDYQFRGWWRRGLASFWEEVTVGHFNEYRQWTQTRTATEPNAGEIELLPWERGTRETGREWSCAVCECLEKPSTRLHFHTRSTLVGFACLLRFRSECAHELARSPLLVLSISAAQRASLSSAVLVELRKMSSNIFHCRINTHATITISPFQAGDWQWLIRVASTNEQFQTVKYK